MFFGDAVKSILFLVNVLEAGTGREEWWGRPLLRRLKQQSARWANMGEVMKNLRTMFVLTALVALVAIIPVAAQVGGSTGSAIEVKFTSKTAFYVGDKLMQPGEYEFRNGGGLAADTCRFEGKGKNQAIAMCHMSKVDGVTKELEVTFSKINGKLYVDTIKFPTEPEGNSTMTFKIEPTSGEAAAAKAAATKK